jgi:spore coat polysaccharide biosynthesis predicted glycosyltransferase SpsG
VFTGKKIFIAPLDWGLGHATRCVPIIEELKKHNTILLGVTPLTKLIFDEEFPDLRQIQLPGYNVRYSTFLPLWLKLGLDYPRISGVISGENKVLKNLIDKEKIDVVISDNRFGLYSRKAHCVFITHQLFLKTPVLNALADSINRRYVLKFNEVWVPDFENETESLSGELSHGKLYHKQTRFIGPQSRLKDIELSTSSKKYDLLILLSGPEPQRSILEDALLKKFEGIDKKIALVRGTKVQSSKFKAEGLDVFELPDKKKLKELIVSSEKIICRSGYSTLMDMYLLGKKDLILIPTKGQTEQEYLAEYWQRKFNTIILDQNKLNLTELI